MKDQYISNKIVSIGVQSFPDIRKKPCLCVMDGNECTVLGTFKNEECAKFFMKNLAKLTGALEIPE